jgi:hypothetical protein
VEVNTLGSLVRKKTAKGLRIKTRKRFSAACMIVAAGFWRLAHRLVCRVGTTF